MTTRRYVGDLLCLVADKNQEQALRGLFSRPMALDLRPFSYEIFVHPGSDPGCCQHCHEFLRPFHTRYEHSLVLFDLEGCGQDADKAADLETSVERRLRTNGWEDRGRVVVIDPELEAWVWSPSPEVDRVLGWSGRNPGLRSWLVQQDLWSDDEAKPARPKEAIELALREIRRPRSSAIYGELGRTVSVRRCRDRSFGRLKRILRAWFSNSERSKPRRET